MIGPERCLVDTFSATSCLPSNIRLDHSIPITRTHSDLVKFTHRDAEFDSIVFALEQILRGPSAHRDCRYEMDEKDRECVKDLHTTDPWLDKQRIEKTKGGLLNDSYLWILDSPDFRLWRHDEASRLLWIRGDPGHLLFLPGPNHRVTGAFLGYEAAFPSNQVPISLFSDNFTLPFVGQCTVIFRVVHW